MNKPRYIALCFLPGNPHYEQMIEGVLDFARHHGRRWSFLTAPESLNLSLLDLQGWNGDGVIAGLNTAQEAALAGRVSMPVVNVTGTLARSPVPRISVDNEAIGELAAEHLLGQGHRRLAFYGLEQIAFSRRRQSGYEARLAEPGLKASVLLARDTFRAHGYQWLDQLTQLERWLGAIAKPLGVFAVSDYRARMVLDACNKLGLRVPHDVAILGVDNDTTICEHSEPTLSSIARNSYRAGLEAARQLDRMMLEGAGVADREVTIEPEGVVQRESTDAIAVEDARLREAVHWVHRHIDQPISIERLLEQVHVSRRWLEYEFRKAFDLSPHQYITRRRVDKAKKMLTGPERAYVAEVAKACGFTSAKQFSAAFRRIVGQSPSDYRSD